MRNRPCTLAGQNRNLPGSSAFPSHQAKGQGRQCSHANVRMHGKLPPGKLPGKPQLDVPEPGDSYTAASTLLRCTSLRASSSLRELPETEVSRGAQTESGQQRHSLSRNFLVPELALARGRCAGCEVRRGLHCRGHGLGPFLSRLWLLTALWAVLRLQHIALLGGDADTACCRVYLAILCCEGSPLSSWRVSKHRGCKLLNRWLSGFCDFRISDMGR